MAEKEMRELEGSLSRLSAETERRELIRLRDEARDPAIIAQAAAEISGGRLVVTCNAERQPLSDWLISCVAEELDPDPSYGYVLSSRREQFEYVLAEWKNRWPNRLPGGGMSLDVSVKCMHINSTWFVDDSLQEGVIRIAANGRYGLIENLAPLVEDAAQL